MINLQDTGSPVDRQERAKINQNWRLIRERFINVQKQISLLSGGQEVDVLITRIETAITNAENSVVDINESLDILSVELPKLEMALQQITQATQEAVDAKDDAVTATQEVNTARDNAITATQQANQAVQTAIDAIADATLATQQANTARDNAITATEEANTAITNAENATELAQNTANDLLGLNKPIEEFSLTKAFLKHQAVRSNGSTYRAKQNTQNNPLPTAPAVENVWWTLEAQRGVDGTGAVSSVNGTPPDETGNVDLPIPEPIDPTWENIQNKPTTFTPSAHTHPIAEVVGLETVVNNTNASISGLQNQIDNVKDIIGNSDPIQEETLVAGSNTVESESKTLADVKRIDGRTIVNFVPLFDSGTWSYEYGELVTPNSAKLTETGAAKYVYTPLGGLKKNVQYTLSYDGNVKGYIDHYNGTTHLRRDSFTSSPLTFTTPTNATTSTIALTTTGLSNGEYLVSNVSVVEGSQPKQFSSNIKGLTNPTIFNAENDTSIVIPTTLYDGEYVERNELGQLVKHVLIRELLLDDSLSYVHVGNGTGFKQIGINGIRQFSGTATYDETAMFVKHNGKILTNGTISELGQMTDVAYLYGSDIRMTISNDDAGWIDSYTPTADEIKAYFLGWKMYNFGHSWGPYDPSLGVIKGWQQIPLYGGAPGLSWVPTTQASIDPKWKPYKLLYRLSTPIKESINSYGSLIIENGENDIKLTTGRIINEVARLTSIVSGDLKGQYVWNNKGTDTLAKYRVGNVVHFKVNNVNDESAITYQDSTWSFGKERVVVPIVKTGSLYTVDYDPLYTFEVSLPVTSAVIELYPSVINTVEELVNITSQNISDIELIRLNAVYKNELALWIYPTLFNGWVNFDEGFVKAGYFKDSLGYVHIRGFIKGGIGSTGEMIFTLPAGYRPALRLAHPILSANGSAVVPTAIHIGSTGNVVLGVGAGNNWMQLNAIFKAEG